MKYCERCINCDEWNDCTMTRRQSKEELAEEKRGLLEIFNGPNYLLK